MFTRSMLAFSCSIVCDLIKIPPPARCLKVRNIVISSQKYQSRTHPSLYPFEQLIWKGSSWTSLGSQEFHIENEIKKKNAYIRILSRKETKLKPTKWMNKILVKLWWWKNLRLHIPCLNLWRQPKPQGAKQITSGIDLAYASSIEKCRIGSEKRTFGFSVLLGASVTNRAYEFHFLSLISLFQCLLWLCDLQQHQRSLISLAHYSNLEDRPDPNQANKSYIQIVR